MTTTHDDGASTLTRALAAQADRHTARSLLAQAETRLRLAAMAHRPGSERHARIQEALAHTARALDLVDGVTRRPTVTTPAAPALDDGGER